MNTSSVSLLQISDSHIGKNESFLLKGVRTYSSLNNVLSNPDFKKSSFVSVTGDISEDGSLSSYLLFQQLIKNNEINVSFYVPGNHDNHENMVKAFGETYSTSVRTVNNWMFIPINSQVVGEDFGVISKAQLENLHSLAVKNKDKFLVIFLHHHSIPVGSECIDKYMLKNSDEFHSILQKEKNIRAVISGHVHQEFDKKINHIEFFCTPSTCIQFKPKSHVFEVDELTPGYRTYDFHADGQISSQVKYLQP